MKSLIDYLCQMSSELIFFYGNTFWCHCVISLKELKLNKLWIHFFFDWLVFNKHGHVVRDDILAAYLGIEWLGAPTTSIALLATTPAGDTEVPRHQLIADRLLCERNMYMLEKYKDNVRMTIYQFSLFLLLLQNWHINAFLIRLSQSFGKTLSPWSRGSKPDSSCEKKETPRKACRARQNGRGTSNLWPQCIDHHLKLSSHAVVPIA